MLKYALSRLQILCHKLPLSTRYWVDIAEKEAHGINTNPAIIIDEDDPVIENILEERKKNSGRKYGRLL